MTAVGTIECSDRCRHVPLLEVSYVKVELKSPKYSSPLSSDAAVTSLAGHCHLLLGYFLVPGFWPLDWLVGKLHHPAHVH